MKQKTPPKVTRVTVERAGREVQLRFPGRISDPVSNSLQQFGGWKFDKNGWVDPRWNHVATPDAVQYAEGLAAILNTELDQLEALSRGELPEVTTQQEPEETPEAPAEEEAPTLATVQPGALSRGTVLQVRIPQPAGGGFF